MKSILRKGDCSRVAEFRNIPDFGGYVSRTNIYRYDSFSCDVFLELQGVYREMEESLSLKKGRVYVDEGGECFFVSLVEAELDIVLVWSISTRRSKSFRRTMGIVTKDGKPEVEADVIMTAAALGFAVGYIEDTGFPIQFDMDPLDFFSNPEKGRRFRETVGKMSAAINGYLGGDKLSSVDVKVGLSPGYNTGSVIMGVYKAAGKKAPQTISAPELSKKGKELWERIRTLSVDQYTGRGAYTGFVDNKNTEGDTDPVGPFSTARFRAPTSYMLQVLTHPRWLPSSESPLWKSRKRLGKGSYVPWGMIGGEKASNLAPESGCESLNEADFITVSMRNAGMKFANEIGADDIAMYTHGMIQAIYKAYRLGPNCEPYEVAVGDSTKKMASCLTCAFFMYATGYQPTSIHLGRGESWAPLYYPYSLAGSDGCCEAQVVLDLNNAWYSKCLEWLKIGLSILDDAHISPSHRASRDAVRLYLDKFLTDPTVGGTLVLDAVTIHASESDRISRTLK
ncbi:hypothetical protein GNQ12_05810 [Pseudomonas aeruginosa]|uniref:hypothetical protein n=1 Tax=Pseudomonas aeruginosa TaxID=287 RepID=UPI0012DA21C7|nr:hypothetical protein [Pseudomonas aeruginosa]MUJ04974.1 hypothetical protein [Pseudomonas aeruginosa]